MAKDFSQETQGIIGRRVRWLREEAGWTQAELSRRLGFKDRQTLSMIEAGQRRVSAGELVALMELFDQEVEFFTDPTLLVGEGVVSWRASTKTEPELLDAHEPRIRRLVGLYRHLARQSGQVFPVLVDQLPLDRKSSFEQAAALAERLVEDWELGTVPARRLRQVCDERLDMLAFYLDFPGGISGAALRLPDLGAVAINRKESPGRKNFDFAHEVFHLLTWQTLPPERIDDMRGRGTKARRVEQLANTFASALLMPEGVVRDAWQKRSEFSDIYDWFDRTATMFQVSGQALFYRLKNLEIDASEVLESGLSNLGYREQPEEELPYPYRFVDLLRAAIEQGKFSVRNVARNLECSLDELAELFRRYGMFAPFEL